MEQKASINQKVDQWIQVLVRVRDVAGDHVTQVDSEPDLAVEILDPLSSDHDHTSSSNSSSFLSESWPRIRVHKPVKFASPQRNPGSPNNSSTFHTFPFAEFPQTLDQVFRPCIPLVESIFRGYNATIFAYGQSGAGKTYTISGSEDATVPSEGILQCSFDHIFRIIEEARSKHKSASSSIGNTGSRRESSCTEGEDWDQDVKATNGNTKTAEDFSDRIFLVRCSYIEIYNDHIYDLLNETYPNQQSLSLLENSNTGSFDVRGARAVPVKSSNDMQDVLELGLNRREVADTKNNMRSSRSHALFMITVESGPRDLSQAHNHDRKKNKAQKTRLLAPENELTDRANRDSIQVGKLYIVDLAGAEKLTDIKGARLAETSSINQSLLHLSRVIQQVKSQTDLKPNSSSSSSSSSLSFSTSLSLSTTSVNQSYVPYRSSKLTMLLKDALGGNSYTLGIACIRPESQYYKATLSTLRFASDLTYIRNSASINTLSDPKQAQLIKLQKEVKCFQRLLKKITHQHNQEKRRAILKAKIKKRRRKLKIQNKLTELRKAAKNNDPNSMEHGEKSNLDAIRKKKKKKKQKKKKKKRQGKQKRKQKEKKKRQVEEKEKDHEETNTAILNSKHPEQPVSLLSPVVTVASPTNSDSKKNDNDNHENYNSNDNNNDNNNDNHNSNDDNGDTGNDNDSKDSNNDNNDSDNYNDVNCEKVVRLNHNDNPSNNENADDDLPVFVPEQGLVHIDKLSSYVTSMRSYIFNSSSEDLSEESENSPNTSSSESSDNDNDGNREKKVNKMVDPGTTVIKDSNNRAQNNDTPDEANTNENLQRDESSQTEVLTLTNEDLDGVPDLIIETFKDPKEEQVGVTTFDTTAVPTNSIACSILSSPVRLFTLLHSNQNTPQKLHSSILIPTANLNANANNAIHITSPIQRAHRSGYRQLEANQDEMYKTLLKNDSFPLSSVSSPLHVAPSECDLSSTSPSSPFQMLSTSPSTISVDSIPLSSNNLFILTPTPSDRSTSPPQQRFTFDQPYSSQTIAEADKVETELQEPKETTNTCIDTDQHETNRDEKTATVEGVPMKEFTAEMRSELLDWLADCEIWAEDVEHVDLTSADVDRVLTTGGSVAGTIQSISKAITKGCKINAFNKLLPVVEQFMVAPSSPPSPLASEISSPFPSTSPSETPIISTVDEERSKKKSRLSAGFIVGQWRSFVAQRKSEKRYTMALAFRRFDQRYIRCAWRQWNKFVQQAHEFQQQQYLRQSMLLHASRLYNQRYLRAAWREWREYHNCAIVFEKERLEKIHLMERQFTRFDQRFLRAGWKQWCLFTNHANYVERGRHLMEQCIHRHQSRHLRAAWREWTAYTQAATVHYLQCAFQTQRYSAAKKILKSIKMRSLIKAFRSWHEYTSIQRKRKRDLLYSTLLRLGHSTLWTGWRQWKQFIFDQKIDEMNNKLNHEKRERVKAILLRFRLQSLIPSFKAWHTYTQNMRSRRRRLMQSVASRFLYRSLHQAFIQWKQIMYHYRKLEVQRMKKLEQDLLDKTEELKSLQEANILKIDSAVSSERQKWKQAMQRLEQQNLQCITDLNTIEKVQSQYAKELEAERAKILRLQRESLQKDIEAKALLDRVQREEEKLEKMKKKQMLRKKKKAQLKKQKEMDAMLKNGEEHFNQVITEIDYSQSTRQDRLDIMKNLSSGTFSASLLQPVSDPLIEDSKADTNLLGPKDPFLPLSQGNYYDHEDNSSKSEQIPNKTQPLSRYRVEDFYNSVQDHSYGHSIEEDPLIKQMFNQSSQDQDDILLLQKQLDQIQIPSLSDSFPFASTSTSGAPLPLPLSSSSSSVSSPLTLGHFHSPSVSSSASTSSLVPSESVPENRWSQSERKKHKQTRRRKGFKQTQKRPRRRPIYPRLHSHYSVNEWQNKVMASRN